jgi:hypothetical protein
VWTEKSPKHDEAMSFIRESANFLRLSIGDIA